MWSIVYRIFVPGILCMILSGVFAFFEFRSYKKLKKKEKKLGYRIKKTALIVYIMMSLLGGSLAVYGSFDLILKDYVTLQGTYSHNYRGKELYINEIHFLVNNSDHSCSAFLSDAKDLEIGKEYEYTYSKRTEMLLSIKEIQKTEEDDTVNRSVS